MRSLRGYEHVTRERRRLKQGEVLRSDVGLVLIVERVEGDTAFLLAFESIDHLKVFQGMTLDVHQEDCPALRIFPSLSHYLEEVQRQVEHKIERIRRGEKSL